MRDLPSMSKLVNRLGFSTAAVYVPLYDLYRRQRRQQHHFHDGCYWVRMPYKDFPRMFPDLPAAIVSKALGKLEDEGLLRMVHYGRLSWYTITRMRRRVVHKT
jgi:hypothetical protein